jgi:putative ABC transport system permease protein
MAVRASLGARRARLVQQLLVENLLMALAGGGLGCLLAFAGNKLLVPLIPEGLIPNEAVIRLSVPVLLFSLTVAMLTALVFGLVPALLTARRDIAEPLKDSGKGVSGGFRRGRLRNALVIVEVALSLVLLVGAGLLMRSFAKLQQVDLGFETGHIFVARLPLPGEGYKSARAKQRFFREVLQRIEALPGVVAVAETTGLPPFGGIESEVEITGQPAAEQRRTIFQLCSEGYFPTLGLRLLRGRTLSAEEVNDARKVAVINQSLASRYFGGEDPLGKTIKLALLERLPDDPVPSAVFEIIGIIADAANRGIRDPPGPEAFIPYTVTGAFQRGLLVRTRGEPETLANSVSRAVWAQDRGLALAMTGSLDGFLRRFVYGEPRFSLLMLAIFAVVGLLLVTVGVYSTIAYTVSRQTHEIGIRMALGADRREVLRLVLRTGLRLIAAGIVAGLVASAIVARLLSSQIWGISPHDPAVLASVVALVTAAGLAACYIPALRATRVDPVVALRNE